MWAFVLNNKVIEVTDIDPAGRFHPSLVWVECPDYVQPGYLYDGNDFTLPINTEL
ncbi:Uncharacterised protein [Edwardsiella hoshinae]|uniref:Uncharacterized protein n=1 Tax=Edwardsiella hoshinae TaxID=93378 RepID=A0A376DL02_9GAMM|nr:Uncharacterised protein [Edwardsiella hoshinae]